MEVVRSQRKPAEADGVVPTLPLYRTAPALEVRPEDFELYAIDRLQETICLLYQFREFIYFYLIWHLNREELRKWFLSLETSLFRYRFRFKTPEAQRALMAEFHLPYKTNVKDNLSQFARSNSQSLSADAIFYKVPFEEVPELVAIRRVFIQKGHAYVAMNQVVSLVVTQFRTLLSKALVLTNRKCISMIRKQEKDRLTPLIECLSSSYLGLDYSQPREYSEISLKDIDQVPMSSFPLCMRHLFEKLREDHHLKHGRRMQLGLFLKGIGLKLDDALAFWKEKFSRKVGAERFNKEYAYSICHNYGKEEKRTDYTPYSCQKIIFSVPGVGDHHGCPYHYFSEENLRAAVGKMGVGNRALEDVMEKVCEPARGVELIIISYKSLTWFQVDFLERMINIIKASCALLCGYVGRGGGRGIYLGISLLWVVLTVSFESMIAIGLLKTINDGRCQSHRCRWMLAGRHRIFRGNLITGPHK
ncbi:hypothetical protein ACH5RR_035451 [Cinchona calisaya]|uniref:DNA primase large subunit C-terminal domain-containing protein n=1 Tax=Cinchona calisaya TaxID=153742 RepID=A0ABD2Y551_9GENT